jgi:hypothetical protein
LRSVGVRGGVRIVCEPGQKPSVAWWILTLLFTHAIDNISSHSSPGKCLTAKFDVGLPYWIDQQSDSNCRAT